MERVPAGRQTYIISRSTRGRSVSSIMACLARSYIDRAGCMCLKANSVDAFFRTLASRKLVQSLYDTFLFEVDRDGAARFGRRQAFRKAIDRDDLPDAEQHRAPYRHLADGAVAPDRDSVCRLDVALNRCLPAGREKCRT